jgi:hypothetical protein
MNRGKHMAVHGLMDGIGAGNGQHQQAGKNQTQSAIIAFSTAACIEPNAR